MKRILLVDDHPLNLKLAAMLVAEAGHEAATATDGATALAAALADPPDLVLADLQMPGMDGTELLRRLKAEPRTRGVPVVVLTAAVTDRDLARVHEAGCDGVIRKPLDTRAFAAQLDGYFRTEATG